MSTYSFYRKVRVKGKQGLIAKHRSVTLFISFGRGFSYSYTQVEEGYKIIWTRSVLLSIRKNNEIQCPGISDCDDVSNVNETLLRKSHDEEINQILSRIVIVILQLFIIYATLFQHFEGGRVREYSTHREFQPTSPTFCRNFFYTSRHERCRK